MTWPEASERLPHLTQTNDVWITRDGRPRVKVVRIWGCLLPWWAHCQDEQGRQYTVSLWGNSQLEVEAKK